METSKVGCINTSNHKLNQELDIISNVTLNSVYKEFICGSWQTLGLWNETGRSSDLIIRSYDGLARPTESIVHYPILASIIKENFNIERIKYVRLALLGSNSVILPHKDYLETKKEFLRFHLPLITDPMCFYAEEDKLHRFEKGNLWFLDARKIHSVACFSNQPRLHLILDFPSDSDIKQCINEKVLFRTPHNPLDIPREPLSDEQYKSIISLSSLINVNNIMEIAGILTKLIYRVNHKLTSVYSWLNEIGERSGNIAIILAIKQLEEKSILKRQ